MLKDKPPYRCSKCQEVTFTRKSSALRHLLHFHSDGDEVQIFSSTGQSVSFSSKPPTFSSRMNRSNRALQVYLDERIRQIARNDDQNSRELHGDDPKDIRHASIFYDALQNGNTSLPEELEEDLKMGRLGHTLGHNHLIYFYQQALAEAEKELSLLRMTKPHHVDTIMSGLYLSKLKRKFVNAKDKLKEMRAITDDYLHNR